MNNNIIIFQINDISELTEFKQTHEIRKLGVNDRKLFNKHLKLCKNGVKKLFYSGMSEKDWLDMLETGTDVFLLFDSAKPVARCCIERIDDNTLEAADVRTAKKYRRNGYSKQLVSSVTKLILSEGNKATCRTTADNTPMLKVVDSVGFKFDYGNFLPIEFSRLTADVFDIYKEWSVKTYAEHLKKSGEVKKGTEYAESKAEFEDVYPDGADTKDTWLYIAKNENGESVGVYGYQKSPYGADTAFVTEVVTKEEFRGKGYAKSALAALQADAKQKGFAKMALNVFKHSPAYTMYVKSGFRVIEEYKGSCIMEKKL